MVRLSFSLHSQNKQIKPFDRPHPIEFGGLSKISYEEVHHTFSTGYRKRYKKEIHNSFKPLFFLIKAVKYSWSRKGCRAPLMVLIHPESKVRTSVDSDLRFTFNLYKATTCHPVKSWLEWNMEALLQTQTWQPWKSTTIQIDVALSQILEILAVFLNNLDPFDACGK